MLEVLVLSTFSGVVGEVERVRTPKPRARPLPQLTKWKTNTSFSEGNRLISFRNPAMYMLDRFVAHVVAPYLDKYIKDLNRDHVTVSILSGNVVLHDLELRRNALRELKLPVCVKRGVIRKLTVYIPWARMRSDRLRVEIDGIDITVHPKRAATYAPGEEEA
jgi:hypothetical protein